MLSPIDRLYDEHKALASHLDKAGEPSMLNSVDESFRKSLALAAASYFEVRIREALLDYVTERSGGDELSVSFLKNKAIERQYHTYFDWKVRKANKFYSLFGPGFKERMIKRAAVDESYGSAVAAFLELGELRNNLAHRDFATFPMDKTVDEIYEMFKKARLFVEDLPRCLRGEDAPDG